MAPTLAAITGFAFQSASVITSPKPSLVDGCMITLADRWSAFITFQVGTADVEDKVAGDGCLKCHGDTIMHLEGSHAHHAAFDTDACLGCHDQSDNYAIPIANRAHAVHSANSDCYIYNINGGHRDWEEVTYPSDIGKCVVCHTSGDDSFQTNPFMMPCSGCHVVEGNEVVDHMRQMGGPF